MKVFTVGLDQKPPLKEDSMTEKSSGSPPPGYVSSTRIPLPTGPEIPQPAIVMKKSRGYKGILMVMLAVFLMALFALTLSEIAYNRQRDENFFRLRWAELKHRLGYAENTPYDYYRRMGAERIYPINKNKEMSEALMQIPEAQTQEPPKATTESQAKQFSSTEQIANLKDARLNFLRTILQKIKQQAEDMGFDGTMQVSVIEVEPEESHQKSGESHPLFPNAFPRPIDNPKSNAFLDGFGEIHQPSPFQNNQPSFLQSSQPFEHNKPAEEQWHEDFAQRNFLNSRPLQWPTINSFPTDNFRNWHQQMIPSFPQQPIAQAIARPFDRWSENSVDNFQQPQFPQQAQFPQQQQQVQFAQQQQQFPQQQVQFPQPMVLPAQAFDSSSQKESSASSSDSSSLPSQEVVGEMYGRKFGRMLQDIIANRIQGIQQRQMNYVPPENRIQIEPPVFPSIEEKPEEEKSVDKNIDTSRGWTHQVPLFAASKSDEMPSENSPPKEVSGEMIGAQEMKPSAEIVLPNPGASVIDGTTMENNEQQRAESNKWLVEPAAARHANAQPLAASPEPIVDFPAVKFPLAKNEESAQAEKVGGKMNDAASSNRLSSNPVFFQVDDPSSVEQPAQLTL